MICSKIQNDRNYHIHKKCPKDKGSYIYGILRNHPDILFFLFVVMKTLPFVFLTYTHIKLFYHPSDEYTRKKICIFCEIVEILEITKKTGG